MKIPHVLTTLKKRLLKSFRIKFLPGISLMLFSQLAFAQTSITNDITVNTTWDLVNSPYSIDAAVNVATGVTLTIDPGVTVTFASNGTDLTIDGTLIADGGPGTDTIRFQNSLASVFLSSSSVSSIIDHARFETMGVFNVAALNISSNGVAVTNSKFVDNEVGITVLAGATPIIQDCEMISSNDYGIRVDDGSPTISGTLIDGDNVTNSAGIWIQSGTPSITNCTFQNTLGVGAVWIDNSVSVPTLDNNTFTGNVRDLTTHPMLLDDTYYDNNGLTVIHVDPRNVTANTTWHQPQGGESWVYEMVFGDITVEAGNTLTIEPGVEIVYTSNGQDLFVDGILDASGTVSDSIRIRDGFATIELRAGSGPSVVDYLRMDGMGAFNVAGLVVSSSDATITNSKFVDCEVGVTVLSGTSPTIQDCEFFSSSDYGIRVDNGSPAITNVLIDGDNEIPVGGIWIQQGTPSITNSTIQNTGNSGGIWVNTTDIPTIDNNTFSGNTRDILAHPMVLDDTNFDNNGISTVYIDNANITGNTTWHQPVLPESWNYVVTSALTVDNGATLTIEPGVDIQFTSNGHDLTINGTLNATGTAVDSIRLTGGFATVLLTSSSTGSVLDYVKMEQMGAFNVAGLLISSDATIDHSKFSLSEVGITVNNNVSAVIQNSEFYDFSDYGIQIDNGSSVISNVIVDGNGGGSGGIWIQDGTPSITGSTLQNTNGFGILIDAAVVPTIDGNSFSGNVQDLIAHPEILDDENFDNNGLSLVHIDNKAVTTNTTWQKAQAPESWVFSTTGAFSVDAGVTLDIEPGVEIQFAQNSHDLTVNGTLNAAGTASDSIRFTSGFATILLSSSSTGSVLDYVKMEQMGAFNVAGLQISSDATVDHSKFSLSEIGITITNNSSPTVQNSEFFDFNDYGIRIDNGSALISSVLVDGNNGGTGGIWIQDGTPSITSSTIQNTNGFGILIDAAVVPVIDGNSFSGNVQDLIAHPEILDDENFDNNGLSLVHIDNKAVTANTTWQKAQAPENWIFSTTGAFSVDAGVTLDIEPGVEIQFAQSSHDLTVNGTLNAAGTASDSIRFTSGFATILLASSSTGSVLDYVKMEQMGAFNVAGLQISSDATIDHSKFSLSEVGITVDNNASPVIQNSEFFDFNDYGLRIDNGSASITNVLVDGNSGGFGGIWIQDGTPSITGSTIQNTNGFGILIDAAVVPVIDGNSFSGNVQDLIAHPEILDDENFDNNGLSLVHIDNKAVTANTTWQKAQAPENWIFSTTGAFSVDAGVTLDIEPGVEIQFAQSSHDLTVNGTLLAQGTAADPIGFNSGGATIFLSSSSTGSMLDYIVMEQLGAFNVAGLAISSDATISNSIFEFCEVGISVANAAALSVSNTLIKNSSDYGILVTDGSPSISNSAIYDNPTGISNTGLGFVDAANNWWGDVTGPTHLTNPSGTGDIISDNVNYTPFLTENPLEPNAPTDLITTEISDTQIDLSWTDNSSLETGYLVERSDGNNTSYLQIATLGADVVSYSDNSVTADNGYFYRVLAVNGIAISEHSNEKFGSTITSPGYALQFDGTDDDVLFSEPLQNTWSDFTVEFWAKIPVTNSGQVNYFDQQDPAGGGTPQFVIAAAFNNAMYMFLRETNGGSTALVQGSTLINDDTWHHLAYVREGIELRVYLDGQLEGTSAAFAGDIVFPGTAVADLGGDATLDEFRLWNLALDQSQIQNLGSSSIVGNEANLVSYYRFDQDETTDLILPDRSTGNNNGTWSGSGGVATPQWVVSEGFSTDILAPTVITQDITVSLDASGNVSVTADDVDNGSTDNLTSTGDLILSLDITDFDCTNVGDNTVVLTVDDGRLVGSAPATVTVVDDILPTVVTQDISITLDVDGMATIVPGDVDNGTTDNCTISLSLDIDTFDDTDIGSNTVTLTATDNSGNFSSATAQVEVMGNNQPPDITYIFHVEENSPTGLLIGTVVATDPEMDPVTYSILSGNTNNAFAIGSSSGDITIADESALDFEITQVFDLIVQADDGNGGLSMVGITINLIDIDEDALGIDDLENKISVYPNPASERLVIELDGTLMGDFEIKLFSVSGNQVLTESAVRKNGNDLIEVNLMGINPGIYLLKIINQNDVVTKNILVR